MNYRHALVWVLILGAAYLVGVKYPSPGSALLGKVGLS